MPELPEAEITKRKLKPLLGKTIAGFWSDWPKGLRVARSIAYIKRDIHGRRILDLKRHGKAIFLILSGDRLLVFHQRMSGSLIINPHFKNLHKNHIHTKLFFKDGVELCFIDPRKFGIVWYGQTKDVLRDGYISSLGPDILRTNLEEFQRIIMKHKGRLKPLLLRQDVFSGIGNIIADEALWLAKVNPKRTAGSLRASDAVRLFDALKKTIKKSIKAKGTSMRNWYHPDGKTGGFQNHMLIYGIEGGRCRRCGGKIKRILVGGRGTWLCANCQKFPQ